MNEIKPFTFEDISEIPDPLLLPPLDRDVKTDFLTKNQADWVKNGVLELPNFMPENLLENYKDLWIKENTKAGVCTLSDTRFGGWPVDTPYMGRPDILNLGLYPPLMAVLKSLIGDDMGMHLNLTGWKSTQRNWHQDDYLNPAHVNCWYAAVWVTLDDVNPDSGPFEYVPGSHKWPLTRQSRLFGHIPQMMWGNPAWPTLTQEAVSKAFEDEIQKRGVEPVKWIPNKGDVLIWHGRLAHRGTVHTNPNRLRKAFISHYSALSKRMDMPRRREHTPGCWYFEF